MLNVQAGLAINMIFGYVRVCTGNRLQWVYSVPHVELNLVCNTDHDAILKVWWSVVWCNMGAWQMDGQNGMERTRWRVQRRLPPLGNPWSEPCTKSGEVRPRCAPPPAAIKRHLHRELLGRWRSPEGKLAGGKVGGRSVPVGSTLYYLTRYTYQECAWDQSQLCFSSMISFVAKDMCVTKTRFQVFICVGTRIKPLKTYIT
jgi:hypothetical protein